MQTALELDETRTEVSDDNSKVWTVHV